MLKKLLSRINAVDIAIIVLLLVTALSISRRYLITQNSSSESIYTISAICESCPRSVADKISAKSDIYDYESHKKLGTIIKTDMLPLSDGITKLSLTISTKARRAVCGISSGDTLILVGKYINLMTCDSLLTARIESIK